MASKGFTESDQETGTRCVFQASKMHLQCAGGAYSTHPDPLAGVNGACWPLLRTPSPLSAFGEEFRPFGPYESPSQWPQDKFLATPWVP